MKHSAVENEANKNRDYINKGLTNNNDIVIVVVSAGAAAAAAAAAVQVGTGPQTILSIGFTPCRHKAIFRVRTYSCITQSGDDDDFNENRRKRHDALLFSISGMGSFNTKYPYHTDTAGHTKAFDDPVTQTRVDTPRPLITQSHRHGWTYQGL